MFSFKDAYVGPFDRLLHQCHGQKLYTISGLASLVSRNGSKESHSPRRHNWTPVPPGTGISLGHNCFIENLYRGVWGMRFHYSIIQPVVQRWPIRGVFPSRCSVTEHQAEDCPLCCHRTYPLTAVLLRRILYSPFLSNVFEVHYESGDKRLALG